MSWLCLAVLFCSADAAPAAAPSPVAVVPGVVLTLLEQADVPARQAGVLHERTVREGQVVEAGQPLGRLEDIEARLRLAKATSELRQATQVAENEIRVRFARKSAEVATAELQRASAAVARFDRSVSQSELDRLQLLADKAGLEIEQAQIDQQQARLACDVKRHELELAEVGVERHRLPAPLTGVVVQWYVQAGEWVEPGAPVARVIRLNRLRAEGFAKASEMRADRIGTRVRLILEEVPGERREYPGELVYVSPEIDPVTGQVRFWAEVENPRLELRPGLQGSLELLPSQK